MEKYLEIVVSSKDQAFLMASYLLAVEDEHQEKGDEARYEMSDLPSPERGRGHCFLKCKLVKLCWQIRGLEPVRQQLLLQNSAWDFVQAILSLKEEVQLKTVIFLWKWWSVRNK